MVASLLIFGKRIKNSMPGTHEEEGTNEGYFDSVKE